MREVKRITELSNELTYHRYLLNQGQLQNLFKDISIPEYTALHIISRSITDQNDSTGRAYLKDIAEELHLTVPKTSKMIGNLRDKGLVSWLHDGNGSEGTYITMTDLGIRLMEKQEGVLNEYYGRVVEKFGQENMTNLLQLMVQLETVMDDELRGIGDGANDI